MDDASCHNRYVDSYIDRLGTHLALNHDRHLESGSSTLIGATTKIRAYPPVRIMREVLTSVLTERRVFFAAALDAPSPVMIISLPSEVQQPAFGILEATMTSPSSPSVLLPL